MKYSALHFCSFVDTILICAAQKTIVEVLDRPHICNKIYTNLPARTRILSNGTARGNLQRCYSVSSILLST